VPVPVPVAWAGVSVSAGVPISVPVPETPAAVVSFVRVRGTASRQGVVGRSSGSSEAVPCGC